MRSIKSPATCWKMELKSSTGCSRLPLGSRKLWPQNAGSSWGWHRYAKSSRDIQPRG